MKKILLIVLDLMFTIACTAQIKIESVTENLMDLTAATQKRLDLNGSPCALVKIEMISPEASFQGNVVGNVAYNVGEYFVYVSPGSKLLKLMHPGQTPLTIEFPKYGISQLKGEVTYCVKLSVPSNIRVVDLEELIEQAKKAYFDEKDYPKAFSLYKKASEYNSPDAMFMVSLMMSNGNGVEKNEQEAHKWGMKAAELGHPLAQYNLGVNYFEGQYVAKDMRKGVEWFTKAANQGVPVAMYNLGIAYEFGYGVEVNYDEAESQYYNALQKKHKCSEDLERVREKNSYPESKFEDFSLVTVKAGNLYCVSLAEWGKLSNTRKLYFDKIGIYMEDTTGKPFFITERNTDNEIDYQNALGKYGDQLLTESQAKAIENNTEKLISSLNNFGFRPMGGQYWISSDKGNLKCLVFASDAPFAVILQATDDSVAGVRPIINPSTD